MQRKTQSEPFSAAAVPAVRAPAGASGESREEGTGPRRAGRESLRPGFLAHLGRPAERHPPRLAERVGRVCPQFTIYFVYKNLMSTMRA